MSAVYFDAAVSDDTRRSDLYRGNIFVYSALESMKKFCELARTMIEEAFDGMDPLRIHEKLSAEQCAEVLNVLKPKFIHHPKSKEYISSLLIELGCDPETTYFDVPRLRTAFPGDFLKTGIAYAFHPHRDTWYSAPMCQLNWWGPVYEITPDNSMAFHPNYFNNPVRNGSSQYNYQEWTKNSRFTAAKHVTKDTRVQPHPEEPLNLDPDLRIIPDVGGLMIFSAAQLHSTVPNTTEVTRYSIDFRTVNRMDVRSRHGAVNVDSACTGTTMGDYIQIADRTHIPDEEVDPYYSGTPVAHRQMTSVRN